MIGQHMALFVVLLDLQELASKCVQQTLAREALGPRDRLLSWQVETLTRITCYVPSRRGGIFQLPASPIERR
jgi:hypothetical protein